METGTKYKEQRYCNGENRNDDILEISELDVSPGKGCNTPITLQKT